MSTQCIAMPPADSGVTSTGAEGIWNPNPCQKEALEMSVSTSLTSDNDDGRELTAAQLDGRACIRCGRTWRPGDRAVPVGHGPNGGQLFECSGNSRHYACRVHERVRRAVDANGEPLILPADVLDLSLHEFRQRLDGDVPWNLDQLERLADYLGVDVWSLFGDDQAVTE